MFGSAVGWKAQSLHGSGHEKYYGWNLWNLEDVQCLCRRLRDQVTNPEIILEQICPYCTHKVDCLFSDGARVCNPQRGL